MEQSKLCTVNNLFSFLVCKGCEKRRAVYVLSIRALLKSLIDLSLVKAFLNLITETYTCGSDYSEEASYIKLTKKSFRPYTPTYSGTLALCCQHPIEEKLYKLEECKKTCYVCGENSTEETVTNQFPLCTKVSNYIIHYYSMCHTQQYQYDIFSIVI
jgi:hypothetical protein